MLHELMYSMKKVNKNMTYFLFLSSSNRRVKSSKSTSSPPALLDPGILPEGRLLLGTDGRSGKAGGAEGADGGFDGPVTSEK